MKEIFRRQHSLSFLAKFLLFCYQVSLLVTVRELWWMNQELFKLGEREINQKWSQCMECMQRAACASVNKSIS
jgi:hypothetical protein